MLLSEVSHGARPVHIIITMIKWIQPSKLSIKNSISRRGGRDLLSLDRLGDREPQLSYLRTIQVV